LLGAVISIHKTRHQNKILLHLNENSWKIQIKMKPSGVWKHFNLSADKKSAKYRPCKKEFRYFINQFKIDKSLDQLID
jgi:hypothetical protein